MPEAKLFDRNIKSIQRKRSCKILENHDFILKEIGKRLGERLNQEINKSFDLALDIGSRSAVPSANCINKHIKVDSAISFVNSGGVCADEEMLPFKKESFDLITSNLNLHWVNDLPRCLIEIRNLLKEKGLFLGAIFGGRTLNELRQVINEAELEIRGGVSPRLAPLVETKDAGMLLQKCGFHLPVVDAEEITALYPNFTSLVKDLRGMGETNALLNRAHSPLSKELLNLIEQKYKDKFPGEDGTIKVTFEVLTLTGWKS